MLQPRTPVAVCTGDVHFTVKTLALATESIKIALAKAIDLNVPLMINGDLLDTKAIIRAECANALISLLKESKAKIIVSVGNHDRISHKSKEHSLNFLTPYATVIDEPQYVSALDSYVIPYQDSLEELRKIITSIPKNSTLFMHQGIKSAYLGDYVTDNSSIDPSELADFRVILSHYHRAQDIGTCSFIGSPYSITFTESNDGPKGVQVLYSDGSLELVPTNLRRHVILERTTDNLLTDIERVRDNDLLWLKVTGPKSDLDKLDKSELGKLYIGHENFKLDKIPTKSVDPMKHLNNETNSEIILDALINNLPDSQEYRDRLRGLWRQLLEDPKRKRT